jgi:hypothetical protein
MIRQETQLRTLTKAVEKKEHKQLSDPNLISKMEFLSEVSVDHKSYRQMQTTGFRILHCGSSQMPPFMTE